MINDVSKYVDNEVIDSAVIGRSKAVYLEIRDLLESFPETDSFLIGVVRGDSLTRMTIREGTVDGLGGEPADGTLVREVLIAMCVANFIPLHSVTEPGNAATNYELATRLGIAHIFDTPEP